MIALHKLPYGHDIAFAIRDDDISFFTDPTMLEAIYKTAWELGFKVSFAAVPNHKGTDNLNVPPEYRKTGKYYNIRDNPKLVEFLREKLDEDNIEIMQHGYCHSEDENLPGLKFNREKGSLTYSGPTVDLEKYSEFYHKEPSEVIQNILKGKKILEETFGTQITTFVAPQEYFSTGIWYGLKEANYDYCGCINRHSFIKIPPKNLRIKNIFYCAVSQLLKQDLDDIDAFTKISDIVTIPATYRHYWNRYTDEISAENSMTEFITIFEKKKALNGYFILLTHYWEYFYDWKKEITQKDQLEYLHKILSFVQENSDSWKCSISELIQWQKSIEKVDFAVRKGKIEIFSPFEVKGLCLLIQDEDTLKKIASNHPIIERKGKTFVIININAGERKIISTT
jgi:predicted deacetylase